jgi:hypothetical protein
MAISNHERVGRALALLKEGLYPYIDREMKAVYKDRWHLAATPFVDPDNTLKRPIVDILREDVAAQLKLLGGKWDDVFKSTLGRAERTLISELRTIRNTWAHGSSTVSTDDAYRALDSVARILNAISAAPQADAVEKQRYELLRLRFEDQARRETRRAAVTSIEALPQADSNPGAKSSPLTKMSPPVATNKQNLPLIYGKSSKTEAPTNTASQPNSSVEPISPKDSNNC